VEHKEEKSMKRVTVELPAYFYYLLIHETSPKFSCYAKKRKIPLGSLQTLHLL